MYPPLPLGETTAWMQEVEQRMEQLPRVRVRRHKPFTPSPTLPCEEGGI